MMKLRYAKTSPFVRKVLVFADEVGMADRIELAPTDVWTAETDIARDNPLGKVPALVTREGTFVGSFACCDYLERRNGAPKLIPDEPKARWRVMQMHGLADGLMEAAVDTSSKSCAGRRNMSMQAISTDRWRRSSARSMRWRRGSTISPASTSARSRRPARSAISTSASPTSSTGGRGRPALPPGTQISRNGRRCRRRGRTPEGRSQARSARTSFRWARSPRTKRIASIAGRTSSAASGWACPRRPPHARYKDLQREAMRGRDAGRRRPRDRRRAQASDFRNRPYYDGLEIAT
ncbi:MAG: glutathione S-transferase N-terminal domain-containing protein [Methylobacteriaceae bacterium]|nr:glutathione S-transferase N-terminal domain-containing protein [Methylobacteriaceae bacterium]